MASSETIAAPAGGWWPAFAAALVAAAVGFGGTVALLVEVGHAFGGSDAQIQSLVLACCAGTGISGLWLSLTKRMPIVTAWSTPSAAFLIASSPHADFHAYVGASIVAAATTLVIGFVPPLTTALNRIPTSVSAAMLAGVLLPFCLGAFAHVTVDPWFVGTLLAVYVAVRAFAPMYALLAALAASVAFAVARSYVDPHAVGFALAAPLVTTPSFSWQVVAGIGLPLFLVTMASQNLPGIAVMRASGYDLDAGNAIRFTAATWLALAPIGAESINLAALTAAICTDAHAHPDPARRYIAGVFYGGIYLVLAVLSGPLVRAVLAIPHAFVLAFAGLALVGPLSGALAGALAQHEGRDAAIFTFLTVASGITIFGIGSAMWGIVAGLAVSGLHRVGAARA